MHSLLMGYKKLDFVNSEGKTVKGTQLHHILPEDDVIGEACVKTFLQDGFPLPDLEPGQVIDITYNHRKKVIKVDLVSMKQGSK
ncbi:MAG: hypothetical protein IJB75_08250 [Oscillospiraceae bacterium]|nr:hypothetical protein [Oscillospiraceae bacterium]